MLGRRERPGEGGLRGLCDRGALRTELGEPVPERHCRRIAPQLCQSGIERDMQLKRRLATHGHETRGRRARGPDGFAVTGAGVERAVLSEDGAAFRLVGGGADGRMGAPGANGPSCGGRAGSSGTVDGAGGRDAGAGVVSRCRRGAVLEG